MRSLAMRLLNVLTSERTGIFAWRPFGSCASIVNCTRVHIERQ
jgi:hypothetical protein